VDDSAVRNMEEHVGGVVQALCTALTVQRVDPVELRAVEQYLAGAIHAEECEAPLRSQRDLHKAEKEEEG
jgi:hypothetical protein